MGRRASRRSRPTTTTSPISAGVRRTPARPRSRRCSGSASDVFAGPFGVYSALTDSDVGVRAAPCRRTGRRSTSRRARSTCCSRAPDRTLRQSAWESYADGYLGRAQRAGGEPLAARSSRRCFQARVRRYESPLAASLSRSNVPVEVFDNLIATFEANLPTWHRYWRLRQRIHGVDRLAPYDLAAPLGASSPELEYEQCVEWICASLEPLGRTYVDTVRRGCLEERWVDVYPTAGKMGGAFSAGVAGNGAVHRDELRRDGREPRHARARARPLDALVPQLAVAAAGLHPLLDVRRPRSRRTSTRRCSAPTCSRPSPIRRCSSPCSRRRWRTSAATSSSCRRSPGSSASSTSGSRGARG